MLSLGRERERVTRQKYTFTRPALILRNSLVRVTAVYITLLVNLCVYRTGTSHTHFRFKSEYRIGRKGGCGEKMRIETMVSYTPVTKTAQVWNAERERSQDRIPTLGEFPESDRTLANPSSGMYKRADSLWEWGEAFCSFSFTVKQKSTRLPIIPGWLEFKLKSAQSQFNRNKGLGTSLRSSNVLSFTEFILKKIWRNNSCSDTDYF